MHEWALAESVIQTVKNTLEEHSGATVRCVRVVLGELQAIDHEIFLSGLGALLGSSEERPFEADAVLIETEAAEFSCTSCGASWGFDDVDLSETDREAIHFLPEAAKAYMRCPSCSSADYALVSGRGVAIRDIELELGT